MSCLLIKSNILFFVVRQSDSRYSFLIAFWTSLQTGSHLGSLQVLLEETLLSFRVQNAKRRETVIAMDVLIANEYPQCQFKSNLTISMKYVFISLHWSSSFGCSDHPFTQGFFSLPKSRQQRLEYREHIIRDPAIRDSFITFATSNISHLFWPSPEVP